MNKDDLIKMTQLNPSTLQEREFIAAICDLLNNNVIIPIGSNRHPYADVLHELVENSLLEYEVSQINFISWDKGCMLHETAYRIKPSEPIYEWQWLAQDINTKKVFITLYTKNENPEFINSVPLYRIEETKRVRNA